MTTPTAFISYSWDSDNHKDWVKGLAERLRADGVNVLLDIWEIAPGGPLPEFMEAAVTNSDFVLVICTPGYRERSNGRRGGVGFEGNIITSEIVARGNHEKFIPILRCGTWGDDEAIDAAAAWIRGKRYVDLSGDPYSGTSYKELIETLFGARELAPPIGEPMSTILEPLDQRKEAGPIEESKWHSNELRSELKWSLAACKGAFIALGVNQDIAGELANDVNVGSVLEIPKPGLHLLLGDQGSGKTLAAHRLFQQAIADVVDDNSLPFPIFLEAREIEGPVRRLIAGKCPGDMEPSQNPVLVIFDGIDELGANQATALLRELATYADTNPDAIIISTARPLPGLKPPPCTNTMTLPYLDAEQSDQLIRKVGGDTTGLFNPAHWRDSVRESAKLPLFAIMIGQWLARHSGHVSLSGYALVEDVARDALRESSGNSEDTDRLLQLLAVGTITRGGSIRPHKVTPVAAEQRILTDSRLVREFQGTIDFALPIFREWYAARAILEGTVPLKDIDLTLDRWAIPLSIVCHSEDDAVARSAMKALVYRNLGMAGAVLNDDDLAKCFDDSVLTIPLDATAIGEEIRGTMEIWQAALGPLFVVLGPVDPEGNVPPLGVCLDQQYLITGWYRGVDQVESVIEFPETCNPFKRLSTREEVRDWPSYTRRRIPETGLWSWILTKDELVKRLKEALEDRKLAYVAQEAVQELVWEFALDNFRRRSQDLAPIVIQAVLDKINGLLSYGPSLLFPIGRRKYSWDEMLLIRDHLEDLLQRGEEELFEPWPSADLPSSSPSISSSYSHQRLLERVTEIYLAALRIYESMVNAWLSSFIGLRLASLLPVRLEGTLTVNERRYDVPTPSLSWYPVLLPIGEDSCVSFQLGPSNDCHGDMERYFADQRVAFAMLRGGDPARAPLFYVDFSMLYESSSRPATELAQNWLAEDLRRLSWL